MTPHDSPHDRVAVPVLAYAKQATEATRRRSLRLILVWLGVALVLAGFVLFGVGLRGYVRICPRCGAQRSASGVKVIGLRWEYDVAIVEGPIARFLQQQRGTPCPHRWEFAAGGDYWLGRTCELGRGLDRWQEVRSVESLPAIGQLLNARLNADREFVSELENALVFSNEQELREFFDRLRTDAFESARGNAASRPAD